jgi:SAM-dependent methyltransferase
MRKVKESFFTTLSHPLGDLKTEPVVCNLCGSPAHTLLAVENNFDIRVCAGCGLVYVSPQPCREELPRFYEEMYPDQEEATVASRSLGYVERHLRGLVSRRLPRGGRLLEVGCGYGRFLRALEGLPLELEALEVSAEAASHAEQTVPGLRVQRCTVEEAQFPDGRFDCIVLIAVLEHLKDPRAVLRQLHRWLAPGGVVVILVPWVQNFLRVKRFFPWLPVHFEAPRHLFDFSPSTLHRYLDEEGYGDIRMEVARPYMSGSPVYTALIWGVKLPGFLFHGLTGGRWLYPFTSSFVAHAVRKASG